MLQEGAILNEFQLHEHRLIGTMDEHPDHLFQPNYWEMTEKEGKKVGYTQVGIDSFRIDYIETADAEQEREINLERHMRILEGEWA